MVYCLLFLLISFTSIIGMEPPAIVTELDRLKAEARMGDRLAQFMLAEHYLAQKNSPTDQALGYDLLAKAAEQGHPLAQYKMGQLAEHQFRRLERPIKNDPRQKETERVTLSQREVELLKAAHLQRAIRHYTDAAKQKEPLSQYALTKLYGPKGPLEVRDAIQERYWLEMLIQNRRENSKDDYKGLMFHEQSRAMQRLAEIFLTGDDHVVRSPVDAVKYFNRALEFKALNDDARYGLAMIYKNGAPNVPQDKAQAKKLLAATQPTYAPAQCELGHMAREDGNYADAIDCYRRARTKESDFALGELYEQGLGSPKNQDSAVHYFKQSALAGYLPAIEKLRSFLDSNAEIQYLFGILYRGGTVIPVNEQLALECFLKALKGGHPLAMQALLSMGESNKDAQYHLGLLHRDGIHMIGDTDKAATWLEKAAMQNHAGALAALKEMTEEGHIKATFLYGRLLQMQQLQTQP